jgi:ligand-binding sensor domain-containing protein
MRAASALLCALVVASSLAAQGGTRSWRPDERVVISDFSYITAVGASREMLYVVSPTGIGIYDRRFHRWEPPVTAVAGFPTQPVVVALVDPVDRSLMMGTMSGLLRYDHALELFEQIPVVGGVFDLMLDRDDTFSGTYLRTRYGWQFLTRGSRIPVDVNTLPPAHRRIRAGTVGELLERMPYILAQSPQLLIDQRLRRARFTAGAVAPDNEEVYLGTDGAGLLKIDMMTNAEPMPFGLLAPSVGALALAEDGVWAGTGYLPTRTGFTWISNDVQRYVTNEGPPATGYRFRVVHDLVADDQSLWAATDAGLWHVAPGGRTTRIVAGLVSEVEDVLSLSRGSTGLWVGTERGLLFVDEEGEGYRVDDRVRLPIAALAAKGDTVWVGSELGLGTTWRDAEEIVITGDAADEPLLRDPIAAMAFAGDTLVVGLWDRIAWRPPAGEWRVERVLIAELGDITSLAPDVGGVWIGGTRGFAFYRFEARAFAFFDARGDVPGPVRDVAAGEQYLWVGTDGGLVRFTKTALLR